MARRGFTEFRDKRSYDGIRNSPGSRLIERECRLRLRCDLVLFFPVDELLLEAARTIARLYSPDRSSSCLLTLQTALGAPELS